MGATLTGFGGVGEIGGNAFLLSDGKTKLYLDFGRRFGNDPREDKGTAHLHPGVGDYFDEYLQPRGFRKVRDLAALDLIPSDLSLYRQDLGGSGKATDVAGIIVSHAHADHAGLIPFLRPEIPIFASAESHATLASLQATGTGVDNEYVQAFSKGPGRTKTGLLSTSARFVDGPVRDYDTNTTQVAGDWEITHMPVDHSIHGARGSIITGPNISLAYTGDFRINGRQADDTRKFLRQAAGTDILITEGTNVSQSHKHTGSDHEVEVEGEIEAALDKAQGFVGIASPPRDLDRFQSVWNVARKTGRRLVIASKQAHLLDNLRATGHEDLPDPKTDESIAVHIRAKRKGLIVNPNKVRVFADDLSYEEIELDPDEYQKLLAKDYEKWELPYLESGNIVTSADIGRNPSEYILAISFWTITDLIDIFPQERPQRPGGLYIHSMTQPFNDEMEISDRKLGRWLDAFNLKRVNTHISGHLSEKDLHWAIDEIGARKLVPVHSMHPGLTKDKYEARTGHQALLPEAGKELIL